MKRREFIGLSAYMAAAMAVPLLEECTPLNTDKAIAEPAVILNMLNSQTIVAAGLAYGKAFPEEYTKEKLKSLLLGDHKTGSTAGEIHEWFTKKTNEDFATGQTLMVDGWVFSKTEARQCGLFSLLQSR